MRHNSIKAIHYYYINKNMASIANNSTIYTAN